MLEQNYKSFSLTAGIKFALAGWRWARTLGNSANTKLIGQASDERHKPCPSEFGLRKFALD